MANIMFRIMAIISDADTFKPVFSTKRYKPEEFRSEIVNSPFSQKPSGDLFDRCFSSDVFMSAFKDDVFIGIAIVDFYDLEIIRQSFNCSFVGGENFRGYVFNTSDLPLEVKHRQIKWIFR